MRKLISIMHVSLDGFVGGPNGEMDWISVDEEMFDFGSKFTDKADAGLYGRVTYQMMEAYWPTAADQPNASKHDLHHSRWYNSITKVVISKSMKGSALPRTKILADNIPDEVQKLKQQAGKDIVIYGSATASHTLMQHNLIDEYWLFVNPILLGAGIPLFKNINSRVNLKLVETKTFSTGVTGLHYERKV